MRASHAARRATLIAVLAAVFASSLAGVPNGRNGQRPLDGVISNIRTLGRERGGAPD